MLPGGGAGSGVNFGHFPWTFSRYRFAVSASRGCGGATFEVCSWRGSELQQKVPFSVRLVLKAGDGLTGDNHRFLKHAEWSHPEGAVAVVGAVHDECLFGLGVSGNTQHNVILTFIVPVATGYRVCGICRLIHWTGSGVRVCWLFKERIETCGRKIDITGVRWFGFLLDVRSRAADKFSESSGGICGNFLQRGGRSWSGFPGSCLLFTGDTGNSHLSSIFEQ